MTAGTTAQAGVAARKTFSFGTDLTLRLGSAYQRRDSGAIVAEGFPAQPAIGPGYGLNARLTLAQPLLRGAGRDVGEAALRVARVQRTAAERRAIASPASCCATCSRRTGSSGMRAHRWRSKSARAPSPSSSATKRVRAQTAARSRRPACSPSRPRSPRAKSQCSRRASTCSASVRRSANASAIATRCSPTRAPRRCPSRPHRSPVRTTPRSSARRW